MSNNGGNQPPNHAHTTEQLLAHWSKNGLNPQTQQSVPNRPEVQRLLDQLLPSTSNNLQTTSNLRYPPSLPSYPSYPPISNGPSRTSSGQMRPLPQNPPSNVVSRPYYPPSFSVPALTEPARTSSYPAPAYGNPPPPQNALVNIPPYIPPPQNPNENPPTDAHRMTGPTGPPVPAPRPQPAPNPNASLAWRNPGQHPIQMSQTRPTAVPSETYQLFSNLPPHVQQQWLAQMGLSSAGAPRSWSFEQSSSHQSTHHQQVTFNAVPGQYPANGVRYEPPNGRSQQGPSNPNRWIPSQPIPPRTNLASGAPSFPSEIFPQIRVSYKNLNFDVSQLNHYSKRLRARVFALPLHQLPIQPLTIDW